MKIKYDGTHYYLSIEEFKDFVDLGRIVYYSVSMKKDKIVVKFYDKNKKIIRTKNESTP